MLLPFAGSVASWVTARVAKVKRLTTTCVIIRITAVPVFLALPQVLLLLLFLFDLRALSIMMV